MYIFMDIPPTYYITAILSTFFNANFERDKSKKINNNKNANTASSFWHFQRKNKIKSEARKWTKQFRMNDYIDEAVNQRKLLACEFKY
jgi:hypothetical protein